MARFAHITGWGMAVPERVMTNDDIARLVDTNDEWIQDRTGIRERRIAGPEDTTGSLATAAALAALDVANLQPLRPSTCFRPRPASCRTISAPWTAGRLICWLPVRGSSTR